jgi:hypothetical protein
MKIVSEIPIMSHFIQYIYIIREVTIGMNYLVLASLIGSILIGTGIAANSISVNQVQAVPCGEEILQGLPKECNAIPLDWFRRCPDCPGPLTILDLQKLIQQPPCCNGPPPDHWLVNVNITRGPTTDIMLIEVPRVSLQNTSAMTQNTSAMIQ